MGTIAVQWCGVWWNWSDEVYVDCCVKTCYSLLVYTYHVRNKKNEIIYSVFSTVDTVYHWCHFIVSFICQDVSFEETNSSVK